MQFGWLPTALVPDHTAYLYNVIANRNPEQLDGVSDSQIEMAKDCVYSTDSTSQVKYTFSCLSANEIVKMYAMCERSFLYDWCICNEEYSLKSYGEKMMPMLMETVKNKIS